MTNQSTYEELEQKIKELEQDAVKHKQAEEEFERIFEHSPDMICTGDLDGYFTKINPSFVQVLGYTEEELLKKPFLSFVHDEDVEITKEALIKSKKEKSVFDVKNRYICNDGSNKSIEWKVLSIPQEDRFFAVGRDITERKQVEKELRESEERFRTVMEQSPGAIEIYEPNGKLLVVNDEWESFWNMNKSDVENFNILDDKECERTGLTAAFKKALRGIVCRIPPARYDPKESGMLNGSVRWIDSKMYPIHYQDGKINKIVLVMDDITKRKQAEKELIKHRDHLEELVKDRTIELEKEIIVRKQADTVVQKSEEKYRNLVELSHDLIFRCDSTGHFTYLNPAWSSFLGYRIDEMIGHQFSEFKPLEVEERDKKTFQNILAGKDVFEYETVYKTKTGELKNLVINARLLKDSAGNLIGTQGTAHDITDRKKVEKVLQESEQQLQSLVRNIPAAVVVYDSDTNIIVSNTKAQELLGLTKDQLLGKSVIDPNWRFLSDDGEILPLKEFPVNIVLTSEHPLTDYVIGIQQPDKKEIVWVLVNAVPTFRNKEEIYQVIITFTDITERKRAEKQIKASLKEKETLLQEIHHRVKNNMNVVSSLLKLHGNSVEDERIKEALKESQGRVYAMSAVHETLYSSENLAEIDLESYLSKISGTLIQTYSVNPGKVKLNIDSDKIKLNIEKANPLGLTINEMISNSLKYAFPDEREGEINVIIKRQDKELQLIVMDDGVGIPDGQDWKNSDKSPLQD
jgi:PAS domain S-box-containing protein